VGTAEPGILGGVTEDQGAQGPPRVAIVPAAEGKPGEDVVEEPGKLLRIASMIDWA
jgi:hypothetical protein